jgi:hypothetical protein
MFNASYSFNIILPQFGGCSYKRGCMVECAERSHGCPKSIFLGGCLGHRYLPEVVGIFLEEGVAYQESKFNFFLDRMGGFIVVEGLGRNFCLRMCQKWLSMEDLTRAREGFTVSRDV